MFASTSAQTTSYGTETFFFGKNATFKMEAAFNSLDAGTAVAVRRVKLTFNKNPEVYQAVGGTDATSLHNGPFDVEGEIELLYNATTQRALVTGGTEQAMRLTVANTGATAVIDHEGRVIAQLPPFTRGVLDARVQGRDGLTPYAWWGARLGLWPYLVFALAVVAASKWPVPARGGLGRAP